MKKKTIISSALALLALVSVAGASIPVFAATDSATTTGAANGKAGAHNRMLFNRGKNLSNSDKAALEAKLSAKKTEKTIGRTEIQAALKSGDFQSWVAAEKKYHSENAPILKQINSTNFAKFVEAQNYLEQGRTIMNELGVKGGMQGLKK